MSRRVLIAFLSMFVCGLSITLAPKPALAAGANCDVNTCISICQKRNLSTAPDKVARRIACRR
jgi:hypothetical protein